MKFISLSLIGLFLLLRPTTTGAADTIAQLLGKGSAHELAKLFSSEVEIELPGVEQDTYSKVVAENLLSKFFFQNKPTGSKLLHKINTPGNYLYCVVILPTSKGPYRVSFNVKEENGVIQLVKLLIEADKVK